MLTKTLSQVGPHLLRVPTGLEEGLQLGWWNYSWRLLCWLPGKGGDTAWAGGLQGHLTSPQQQVLEGTGGWALDPRVTSWKRDSFLPPVTEPSFSDGSPGLGEEDTP